MRLGQAQLGSTQFGTYGTATVTGSSAITTSASVDISGIDSISSGSVTISETTTGTAQGIRTMVGGTATITAATSADISGIDSHLEVDSSIGSFTTTSTVGVKTFAARNPALVGTISPPRPDISERDRLENYLKSPFKSPVLPNGEYGYTEYGALVATYAEFCQAFLTVAYQVLGSRYIDHAHGISLDHIGQFVFTPRKTGEGDPKYRLRLKASVRRLVSGGTLQEIRDTIVTLLGADTGQVIITEPEGTPATMDIEMERETVEDSPITLEELVEFVDGFRAGGVDARLTLSGSFMHRSVSDLRNNVEYERGYGEAPYSGRIN